MYRIIGADQKEYGPVSADDMRRWIREGRANAHTLAWLPGQQQWRPLSAFPEFAALFPAQASLSQPGYPPYAPSGGTSGTAIAGFLFSLLGIPCCWTCLFPLLGLVFSLIGIAQTGGNPPRGGRGLAIAGLVISVITLLLALLIWITASISGNANLNQQNYQFHWNT